MKLTTNLAAALFIASVAPALAQNGGTASAKPAAARVVAAETTAAAFKDKNWKAPRTSWGQPSLEGVWSTDDVRGVPLNRPEGDGRNETATAEEFAARVNQEGSGQDQLADNPFLKHDFGTRIFGYSSLVVDPPDGRVPKLTPHGAALAKKRVLGTFGAGPFDKLEDFSLYDRCVTRGVLGSILPVIYGNGLRIAQSPSSVAISYEMIHDTRVIPLDSNEPSDPRLRQWLGVPRGHWDGDTLVVVTTSFTDRTSVGINGGPPPNSEQLTLTERFKRVDPQMIEYRATVDDPGAFAGPFTIRLMITSRPDYETYEYSCHEGNNAVRLGLSGERVYERKVAEAKARGLPIPARATQHNQIRNGPTEGAKVFNINEGE